MAGFVVASRAEKTCKAARKLRNWIAVAGVENNTSLEFLVHRHLVDPSTQRLRSLSLNQFLTILRERYGFFVDTAPPNFPVANELLERNRRTLENRLRDLGLLISVNDAKLMKRLQPRYTPRENC